jgi:hypothetical protein
MLTPELLREFAADPDGGLQERFRLGSGTALLRRTSGSHREPSVVSMDEAPGTFSVVNCHRAFSCELSAWTRGTWNV